MIYIISVYVSSFNVQLYKFIKRAANMWVIWKFSIQIAFLIKHSVRFVYLCFKPFFLEIDVLTYFYYFFCNEMSVAMTVIPLSMLTIC